MDNEENRLFYHENNDIKVPEPGYCKPSLLSINPKLQNILERYVRAFIVKDKEIEIKGRLIDFIRNIH